MLLHLDRDVIKDLKKAAVDRDSSASAIANEAIETWLRENALRGDATIASGGPDKGSGNA